MQILLFSFRYSSFIMNRYLRSLLFASALAVNGSVVGFAGDKWTDSSGTKTIEAEFVKLDGIQLTIKKSDGKEIVIPLYKLDNTSRLLARKLAKTPRSTASAGAAGSDTEAVTTTSSSGGLISSNPTAQEFFDTWNRELEKRNFAYAWDTFTPTQQKDVEQLIQLALTKIDQKSLDEISKFKKQVFDTLRSKKTMILNSKAIPIDNNMKPMIAQMYEPALSIVDIVVSDDLLDLAKLKSSSPKEFLQSYQSRLMSKLESTLKLLPVPGGDPMETLFGPAIAPLKVTKVKNISDSEAIVTRVLPQGPIDQTYVRVDGVWVDKPLSDNWKSSKEEAEKAINDLEPKMISLQLKQALAAAKIPLGILAEAETQSDVDDILGDIVKQVQAAAAANMGAGGVGGFAPPNSQANMTTNPRANKTAASSPSQATGKNTQHRFEQLSFALPERFQRRDIPAGALPPGVKIAAFVDLSPQGTSNAVVSINLMPNKDGDAVNIRQQLVNLTEGTANGMKFKIASRGKNEESEWNGFRFTHFSFLVSSPDGGMVGGRAYGTRHEDDLLLISHIAFVGEPPEIIDEIKDCVATIRIDTTTK
jgi:hypothetical protein